MTSRRIAKNDHEVKSPDTRKLRKPRWPVPTQDFIITPEALNGSAGGGSEHDMPPTVYETILPVDTDKSTRARRVDFVFLYSPTIVGGKYIGSCTKPHDVVLSFTWRRGQVPPKSLTVGHLEPDRPEISKTVWTSKGKKPPNWSTLPPRAKRYEVRAWLIGRIPDNSLRERAAALCEFDRSTDPYQLGIDHKMGMKDDIVALTRFLTWRTMQRASWATQNREFEPIECEDSAQLARAMRVETHVRETLIRINPAPNPLAAASVTAPTPNKEPGLYLRRFEEAITAFVAGELQMQKLFRRHCPPPMQMDGIPDGANLFSFAEAALLFICLGLHRRFWERLLPAFVCTAEYFATYYWDGKRRRLDAYHPKHLHTKNPPRRSPPSDAVLLHLKQRYSCSTPAQLAAEFTSIVGQALRNDPLISRPTRPAKELKSP